MDKLTMTRVFDTEADAKRGRTEYRRRQRECGPILFDPTTGEYTFTLTLFESQAALAGTRVR